MRMHLFGLPRELRQVQQLARDVEQAGFGGITVPEAGRTAYLSIAAAALATERLEFATGIAVAFPRSPTTTAGAAWELQETSRGRFRLGLGTQVRAHITRRYGVDFDPPGPRMRDYVTALRALFNAFQGKEPLDHHGKFYELTLMPGMWSPGAIDFQAPAIDIAAVGPYMLGLAGELCDGVHVHPLHSVRYLEECLEPALAKGAAKANRDVADVVRMVPVFTIVGNSEEERAASRALCRSQVAVYGSTPNYAVQFDLLGFEGTTAKLRERQKAGDPNMADVITDDILQHFTVEARWDDLADRLVERYRGRASRLIMYTAGTDYQRDPTSLDRWGEVARAVEKEA